jgi:hypothetical protein
VPVHIAYGEIVRGAIEAIRMIGFPFGQADDCAEGFVWTQSVLSRGYDLLRLADEQRPVGGWGMPTLPGPELEPRVIQLNGLPLFAYAARLADLTHTIAKGPAQMASIVAVGAIGGWIAPYIAYRMARAGCVAATLWKRGNPQIALDASDTLVMATPFEADQLHVAPVEMYEIPPRHCILDDAFPEALIGRISEDIAQAADGSAFIALAADPRYAGPKVGRSALAQAARLGGLRDAQLGLIQSQTRLRLAIGEGLETDIANLQFFTGLLRRVRVPNSQRSSSQAG